MRRLISTALAALFLLLSAACGGSPQSAAARGIRALNQGQSAKAARLLAKALRDSPDAPALAPAWSALGLARTLEGDPGGAEEALRKAVALAPGQFEPAYNLGALLLREGRLNEADEVLAKAANLAPRRTEALELRADIALNQGRISDAITLLETALERAENPRILNSLALARHRAGAPASSIRDLLGRAIAMDARYAPAHVNLAALLDQLRLEPQQAATHYESYLRLEPESPRSLAVRQRLQVLAERIQTGGVAAPDPTRTEVEALLGQAAEASRAGNAERALMLSLRAASVANRGKRNDLEERALRAASTLAPDLPRGHAALGRFLLEQGQNAPALNSFQRALSLAPGWTPALRGVVEAAVAARQMNVAREALQRAEATATGKPDLQLEIAILYADVLRDSARARRILTPWLRDNPQHPRSEEASARLR